MVFIYTREANISVEGGFAGEQLGLKLAINRRKNNFRQALSNCSTKPAFLSKMMQKTGTEFASKLPY